MPLHEYVCEDCGIQFERLFSSFSAVRDEMPCPECERGSRKIVSASNFAFSHPTHQLRGALPPNTGTSDDWNADRIIGRDADRRWRMYEERQGMKRRILRDHPGATGRDLTRTPDGNYEVMTPDQRSCVERARKTFQDVEQAAKSSEASASKKAG